MEDYWYTENESEEVKCTIIDKLQDRHATTQTTITISLEDPPLKKRSKLFEFMDLSFPNSRPEMPQSYSYK